MPSDSELLFRQLQENWWDETLVAAYADSLEESGRYVRAGLVREYLEICQLRRQYGPFTSIQIEGNSLSLDHESFKLQRRLLIRPIQVGDALTVDEEGHLIPASSVPEGYSYVVGFAGRQGADGSCQVELLKTATAFNILTGVLDEHEHSAQ